MMCFFVVRDLLGSRRLRSDGTGSVQVQACDHEGVPSRERDPHGDGWGLLSLRGVSGG